MVIIKPKHYYLVGIGGISMSGIAALLATQGYHVSGSDVATSPIIERLEKQGIAVNIGQSAQNITSGIDFIVYSAAINSGNPELRQARKLEIPIIKRSELIGYLMSKKFGIAVAGMHGKTTITTMATLILEKAGLDPTSLIGTEVKEIGGNVRVGESDYFLAEACEYYNSFLDFNPKVAIISNIEAEHLDFFGSLGKVLKSFSKFIEDIPPNGFLIACKDNKNLMQIIDKASCPVTTYGFNETADVVAFNILAKAGFTQFDIRFGNKIIKGFELRVPGIHNILNAVAATTLALNLKIDPKIIKETLRNFRGAARRFEILDKISGITVVSDYAHHPTEIQTTLEGARRFYPKSRIFCIFQPHQYKRTRSLLKDFGQSFGAADQVIVPNIYEVKGRDTAKDIKGVSAEKLVNEMKKNKTKAKYIPGFEKTALYITGILSPGDILIIMGAGDIYEINNLIIERLKRKIDYDNFIQKTKLAIKINISLSPHTSFKIGGLADLFFETTRLDSLKKVIIEAHKLKLPIFILGGGSNVLVSDRGFRGLAIKNDCHKIEVKNNIVIAEAGALLAEVAQKANKASLSGLEFATGIPGTIGGAVVNNAGLPRESISNVLTRALIINEQGEPEEVNADHFNFKYRSSKLKRSSNKETILKVELQLKWAEPELINQKIKDLFETRKNKQPYGQASAGSVFKNPSTKISAGELIEKAGLKGKRVGEAEVSKKHANFIVTKKGCQASDVLSLIKKIKESVHKKFNVDLKEEIQYIGEWK